MIRLNLQLFAKSSAYQRERRASIRTMKQNQPGAKELEDEMNKKKEAEKKKNTDPLRSSENITNSEKISSKENYVLIKIDENGKMVGKADRTGAELKDSIAYEKLIQDSNNKNLWKSRKGTRFIIRRKK